MKASLRLYVSAPAFAAGLLSGGLRAAYARTPPGSMRAPLASEFALSPADLDAVSRGEIVAKALPTQDQRDVAVIAVARVDRQTRASLAATRGAVHVFVRQRMIEYVGANRRQGSAAMVVYGDLAAYNRARHSMR